MPPTSRLVALLSLCLAIPSLAAGAGVPAHLWSQRFGEANNQIAYAVAHDAFGNIVVAGSMQGTANFGGTLLTSAGGYDAFVAKFDAAGVHLWSQRFGDASDQNATAVGVDAGGNIVFAGRFSSTVNFGGANLTSAGNEDIFIVKFNSDGIHQWSKRFGDNSSQRAEGVAVDASSNVFITGAFSGTVNFGGSDLVAGALSDIYLAKFDAAGTHQWSQRFGDASTQSAQDVATDGAGNVILCGSIQGSANFGGANLTSAGGFDIFLAKFDAAGLHQWSQIFGDAAFVQQGWAVAVDATNNVILGGPSEGTVDFGGGPLVGDPVNEDAFVAKFNSAGAHQWSRLFGDSPSTQGLHGLAVDASGNIAVSGQYSGGIDFGGGNLQAVGLTNMYLASLDASGAHRWSQRFGGPSMSPHALTFVPGGDVVAVGSFGGTVDFGGASLTATFSDIFLAKFGNEPAEPAILDIVDVPNDQGRNVKIRFVASGGDDAVAAQPILQYEAFRRSDPPPQALGRFASPLPQALGGYPFPPSVTTEGWLFVGSVPAHADDAYEIHAQTLADSTIALGNYNSVFFIRAANAAPAVYFDSAPDSGYSLDNLAPGVPANFIWAAGQLTWNPSSAADFDYFTVYGANVNSFAAATAIGYTVTPALDVSASPYTHYFATATDFSGNEGRPAMTQTPTGTGAPPASYVLSVSAYPNPFNPATTIRYSLPEHGRVTVTVYDSRGARLRKLVNEEKAAGAYSARWDGRSDAGAILSSGVYFVRIELGGAQRSYKTVLLE